METLGPDLCSVLPTVHAVTGSDYASKFSTKKAELNCNPVQFLTNFGISVDDCDMLNSMKKTEAYLVQLWKMGSYCQTLDQLRHGCTTKLRLVWPSTSYHQRADVPKDTCSELITTPICKFIALTASKQISTSSYSVFKLLTTC